MAYTLHIGNKNYSSWSLRAWLMLRQPGIPFTERLVSLRSDAGKAERLGRFPNRRVPCLEDDGFLVWDTLSIAEYLAEHHSEKALWPQGRTIEMFMEWFEVEIHTSVAEIEESDARVH